MTCSKSHAGWLLWVPACPETRTGVEKQVTHEKEGDIRELRETKGVPCTGADALIWFKQTLEEIKGRVAGWSGEGSGEGALCI